MAQELDKKRVIILATDGFEESELTSPRDALLAAGAEVDIVSVEPGEIQGFKHHDKSIKVRVDRLIDDVSPQEYDALVLPGGALNADILRIERKVKDFVATFIKSGKPVSAICHAGWILASAGIARGKRLTTYFTIQDDMKNAGANWVDEEVVVDGNLITSRMPDDLEAFNRETIRAIQALPKSQAA